MKYFLHLSLSMLIVFPSLALAQTIATVGKTNISKSDFEKKYKEVLDAARFNVPTREVFLEDLIRYEMGLQEAKSLNIEKDPVVQDRINQVIYQAFLEKQLGERIANIQVSEAEMRRHYSNNPELRTSHILIEMPPNPNPQQREAARKRATEIYQEVTRELRAKSKTFEELVALYSDDSMTKRSGGDTGWQTRLTIAPEFYDAAFKLKSGQISPLVETTYGFHIIKLTGRNTFERANKRHLRQIVFDIKRKQIFDEYFAQLRRKYPVKINREILN